LERQSPGDKEQERRRVTLQDVCVFVDPVDGTREFVEGRLEAVTCLIGISYRGRAVAGVMARPFAPHMNQKTVATVATTKIAVLFGVIADFCGVTPGIVGNVSMLPAHDVNKKVLAISADKGEGTPALKAARRVIQNIEGNIFVGDGNDDDDDDNGVDAKKDSISLLTAGACGNKILQLLTGRAHVAILNLKSSTWDSCATEALVQVIVLLIMNS
jgi:fructose-1,6-bisphosphatase/inositol monophosphatase family enzyme